MRVAFFVTSFPVPSETFILRQITGLIDLGHEVGIFAATRPASGEPVHSDVLKYGLLARTTYLADSIPMESGYWELSAWPVTGRTWLPDSDVSIPNIKRLLKAIPVFVSSTLRAPRLTARVLSPSEYDYEALSLSALYRLAALSGDKSRYDIVHAHYGPVGRTFRFSRALWQCPLIVSFHGYDYSRFPKSDGLRAYDKLFETVDVVTVNSEHAWRRLEELGCPPSKLRKLHYGIRLDEFPFRARTLPAGEPVRLITVARLVEKKGIEYSLRALAKVREKQQNVCYDIIGEGPLREKLTAVVKGLGMDDVVSLHGAQNSDYVRQMMDKAHVFVLSSVTAADGDQEGTPVSLIEAQACGIPVVSSEHAGIGEVVLDHESGFLVPERDIDGLADRIQYLIEHPECWPQMGRHGRQHIEKNYDLGKLNVELARLYQTTIDR